jgi:predicted amidohydrolase
MTPFHEDHLIASRARALDNRLAHLYANRVGEEAGLRFVGGSRAIGPDGTVVADAGTDGERLLAADVPRAGADEVDAHVDYLALVRDDVSLPEVRPLAPSARGGAHNAEEESHV